MKRFINLLWCSFLILISATDGYSETFTRAEAFNVAAGRYRGVMRSTFQTGGSGYTRIKNRGVLIVPRRKGRARLSGRLGGDTFVITSDIKTIHFNQPSRPLLRFTGKGRMRSTNETLNGLTGSFRIDGIIRANGPYMRLNFRSRTGETSFSGHFYGSK